METQRFAIVGTGPVAREIGRCLVLAGHTCTAVVSRARARAEEAAAFVGASVGTDAAGDIPGDTSLLLVATADTAIVDVARALGVAGVARGRTLVHFAGSLAADAMRTEETTGAAVVSVHPLRHFAPESVDPATFRGTFCAIEGDAAAVSLMIDLVAEIGGDPFPVQSERKALYHAAVVLSLTYSITLFAEALSLLETAGVPFDTSLRLTSSFTDHARAGVAARGPAEALHGPIAHGDVPVVSRFAEALATHAASHGPLYGQLGLATTALASRANKLSATDARALQVIFRGLIAGNE